MGIIRPSLFLVMENLPDRKRALRQMYITNKSFRSLCRDYQKCSEVLKHWAKSESEEAPDRHREYTVLLQELESEIIQSLAQ